MNDTLRSPPTFAPNVFTLPQLEAVSSPETGASDEEKARSIPDPTGWKLLCVVPDTQSTFANSALLKPEALAKAEEAATTVLFVVKVGPDAYKDEAKFPSGPWCKQGDFVLVRTYAGTRFVVYGKEFRLLNDDQIDAVVQDPRGVTRVGG